MSDLPENQRTEPVEVILTPTELDALTTHAKSAGVEVADFLRACALAWDNYNAAGQPMPTDAALTLLTPISTDDKKAAK